MVERICIKSIDKAFQNWDNNPKDALWLQKAEKYIKKLLEKKINQVQLSSYLGFIYLHQKKFLNSKKEFEKCFELTKNKSQKEKFSIEVIASIMHIVNQKINNRNNNYEEDCYEAIKLLQNLRQLTGHYNQRTLQMIEFFYNKIIEKGINTVKEKREEILVDLCYLLDIPEISLNFDFQFKILNSIKYYDFESCWVHIIKHSWDYRHSLKWNQFVKGYLDSFETTFWDEIFHKSQNKELLKLEVWAEYIFALDNIARLYLENGEEGKEELAKLKDAINNKIPKCEDELINENSYAVKQEFISRYIKNKAIKIEKIMRECEQSDEMWYSTIKESYACWRLCFAYQDGDLMNELQTLDDKAIKSSYNETLLEDIDKKIKQPKFFNKSLFTSLSSLSLSSLPSVEKLNNPEEVSKLTSINLDDNEKISFQQSLGICERLSDSFYHLISYILCYDLSWLKQPPPESPDNEMDEISEEDVILSSNSKSATESVIIGEKETRIFLFKDSHLDLIYTNLNQCDDFEDYQFPLENYFTTDIFIIHDPWNLNKILNICMWHMYDGSFHKYLRFLFPNIPEYLNLSYLNSQNDITLEDITCFFLILIIQRHIKCSCNKNLFKSEVSVGQTFFLSVIQHPIATVSSKATKFWYSLVATYGREKYKYMISDIYSQEEINNTILEIRGEVNNYKKNFLKDIWGFLGLHLMDVFMEKEFIDYSVEALHYMALYLNLAKEEDITGSKPSSNNQIDSSSILFDEIYDTSDLCGEEFYEYVLEQYKILKEKKCTRYETFLKNNKTLLNAYINDFNFLSDLEESSSQLSNEYSNDNDEDAFKNKNYDRIEDEENETLVKSNLSTNTSSLLPTSDSKSLEDLLYQNNLNGNYRLSRQLNLLQAMNQKQHLHDKKAPTEKSITESKSNFLMKPNSTSDQDIFSFSSSTSSVKNNKGNDDNIKDNNNNNSNNNTPMFSFILNENKFKERVKENQYINDLIRQDINNDKFENEEEKKDFHDENSSNFFTMSHSNSDFFNNMRNSSDAIDDIFINSDSEESEESKEDIIEKLSRERKQIEQQQKAVANANANASISNAIRSFKSMEAKNATNDTDTKPKTSRRLTRQLQLLNSLKK
jgi:hypothetical protein